ncbi:ImmA/IrrE family metallo-endopeptidase [Deinococcus peraridilitoris]|uniref:Putative Zn peptidase n=1 Tax=Deinococcus peraridilitoris (strain DSM 19664 / LMG 22246 / CIP 109416 / KR-200) TaxID=937777 RepID=L0A4K7_DEIPD|nr:ImmA/IrrE family metallo-endopeptidase [Deinococcus peraridilitoris]AFZ68369.1 putative Zn peptidase [Deinococcus peraridilitoris DSM 19664]
MTANETQTHSFEAHKARMRALAREFGRAHASKDPHALAEGLGARLAYMDLGERDGAYDPEHGVILVNGSHSRERQRFTLAHEVSHALLLADEDLLSDLHDTFDGEALENAIETLCNVGAATILISDDDLRSALERFGTSGQTIAEVARRADVSAPVALYALADFVRTPAMFVVCAPDSALRGHARFSPGRGVVVQHSASTASMRYSLSPGTPIPEGHTVDTAFRTGLPIDEVSFFPFRSGKRMPAIVSAFPQRGRVLCAFEERG